MLIDIACGRQAALGVVLELAVHLVAEQDDPVLAGELDDAVERGAVHQRAGRVVRLIDVKDAGVRADRVCERVHDVGNVEGFCEGLAAHGALLLPGSVYDRPAHVRVGFGRVNLPEALAVLESALAAPAPA